MFGCVNIYKPELKIREYESFRAYYCGLCKAMGDSGNQLARMGLNYDFVFLAILLSSIEEETEHVEMEGCFKKLFKKKKIVKNNKSLDYASDMSIVLVYFKLLDDWRDEKSIKSLLMNIPFLLSSKRIKKRYSSKVTSIGENIERLSLLESKDCKLVDQVADIFGNIMADILVPDYITDKSQKRVLSVLGYNLGRWIYIMDAFEDIKDDMESNSYNPIVLQYEYDGVESKESFIDRVRPNIERALFMSLDGVAKSFELLEVVKNREILENIIYMGIRSKSEHVLGKGDV